MLKWTSTAARAALLSCAPVLGQAQSLDDLRLNELVVTPTSGEFVEILNAGTGTLDLSDVYLTDASFAGNEQFYYRIVSGNLSQAGGGGFSDWHARFPAGATIAPGELQTIALGSGASGFANTYGSLPTYELCPTDPTVADLREALAGAINCSGNDPGLSNSGEVVVLYHWNGTSDLVQDLDYVVWGDKAEAVDKTGVSIDGPDGDAIASAYLADTSIPGQAVVSTTDHGPGNAFARRDPAEGGERQSGGNGVAGDDETSEPLASTFCIAPASPGATNDCGAPPPPPDLELISTIQGAQHRSPLEGQAVTVEAIVTALASDGYYLQEEDAQADGSTATSEALFVVTTALPDVGVGDAVRVAGTVEELRPGDDRVTITRLLATSTTVLATDQPLPAAVILGVDRVQPTQIIDNDSVDTINIEVDGTFDADEDAIDFYESLESMRVQVSSLRVAAASTVFGDGGPGDVEVYALNADGDGAGPRTDNGGVYVGPMDFNPEILVLNNALAEVPLDAVTGDLLPDVLVGVLSSGFGKYLFLPTTPVGPPTAGGTTPEVTALAGDDSHLTIASYNLENFDPEDADGDQDIADGKLASIAFHIVNNLASPDVIGLQEVQDNSGSLNDGVVAGDQTGQALIDAILQAGGPTYEYLEVIPNDGANGGQPGGNIRTAFLFNPGRVDLVRRGAADADDAVVALAGPGVADVTLSPGLIEPSAFPNSRKPTLVELRFNGQTVFVVSNHFNSKGSDSNLFDVLQPPVLNSEGTRTQQAGAVADFVATLLALDATAKVVVLGDLNDFEFSAPLQRLEEGGLTNLVESVANAARYSFAFNGNSQVLDHVLVSDALASTADLDMVHVNSDFPEQVARASDHDPLVARLALAASLAETIAYVEDSRAAGTIVGIGPTEEIREQRASLYARVLRVADARIEAGEPTACNLLAVAGNFADGNAPDLIEGEGVGELLERLASVERGLRCPT